MAGETARERSSRDVRLQRRLSSLKRVSRYCRKVDSLANRRSPARPGEIDASCSISASSGAYVRLIVVLARLEPLAIVVAFERPQKRQRLWGEVRSASHRRGALPAQLRPAVRQALLELDLLLRLICGAALGPRGRDGVPRLAASGDGSQRAKSWARAFGHGFQNSGVEKRNGRTRPEMVSMNTGTPLQRSAKMSVHRRSRRRLRPSRSTGPRRPPASPDCRVANAGADDVGRERLEARNRIFQRPRRIARIEVDADESGPAASTSPASSHACMSPAWFSIAILTPLLSRLVAHGLADLDRVLDVRLDAAVREPSSKRPRTAADDGEPSVRAMRMPSRSCSTAVPAFASNAPEVGQMLNMPT